MCICVYLDIRCTRAYILYYMYNIIYQICETKTIICMKKYNYVILLCLLFNLYITVPMYILSYL